MWTRKTFFFSFQLYSQRVEASDCTNQCYLCNQYYICKVWVYSSLPNTFGVYKLFKTHQGHHFPKRWHVLCQSTPENSPQWEAYWEKTRFYGIKLFKNSFIYTFVICYFRYMKVLRDGLALVVATASIKPADSVHANWHLYPTYLTSGIHCKANTVNTYTRHNQ